MKRLRPRLSPARAHNDTDAQVKTVRLTIHIFHIGGDPEFTRMTFSETKVRVTIQETIQKVQNCIYPKPWLVLFWCVILIVMLT